MKRKVTPVFHDEDLYTQLRIEAVRRRTTASSIVSDAVREWLESREQAGLLPVIDSSRAEWKEKGGPPWSEAESQLEQALNSQHKPPGAKRVQS